MKTCTKCGIDKELTEFYAPKGRTTAGGAPYILPSCKKCFSEYYEKNRERQLVSNQRARIKRRYGISLEEYNSLVAQGCSVCGEQQKRIVLDHCHATNSVRAPLCDGCNLALGGAKDDPATLRALADYLERHAAA